MGRAMDQAYDAVKKHLESAQKVTGPMATHAIELAKVEVQAESNRVQEATNLLKLAGMNTEGSADALEKAKIIMGVQVGPQKPDSPHPLPS